MMATFMFRGTVTLDGVWFWVEAAYLEEARAKVRRGEWEKLDTSNAPAVSWDIGIHLNEIIDG